MTRTVCVGFLLTTLLLGAPSAFALTGDGNRFSIRMEATDMPTALPAPKASTPAPKVVTPVVKPAPVVKKPTPLTPPVEAVHAAPPEEVKVVVPTTATGAVIAPSTTTLQPIVFIPPPPAFGEHDRAPAPASHDDGMDIIILLLTIITVLLSITVISKQSKKGS